MTESRTDFEKISFTNLVNFYRDELLAIENGEPATEVLSIIERRRMKKLGLLIEKRKPNHHTLLTEETRRILNDGAKT